VHFCSPSSGGGGGGPEAGASLDYMESLSQKTKKGGAPVAHTCHHSYSGNGNQEDHCSKPAQQIVHKTLSRKSPSQKKGAGELVEWILEGAMPAYPPLGVSKGASFPPSHHLLVSPSCEVRPTRRQYTHVAVDLWGLGWGSHCGDLGLSCRTLAFDRKNGFVHSLENWLFAKVAVILPVPVSPALAR
jgi:hypothetical protein